MGLATYLNGGTAGQLRGLPWLALSDLGGLGAGTVVSDGGGGGTTVWAYGSAVPCRLDPLLGGEALAADRVSDRSTHLLTVPSGTGLLVASRFKLANGAIYEVVAVRDMTAEQVRSAEVVLIS